jgi:predicted phosphodiesterase
MLIAFISDIHGNLPALRSALADAKRRGAERIYCAGDLVGYGPFPDQVCRALAEEKIATIAGNYDARVLSLLNDSGELKARMKPGKFRILTWTTKHIGRNSAAFLSALPSFHKETLPGGFKLLMVHGSPLSWDDAIYPSLTRHALEKKLAGVERPDILVCGHTHVPFIKKVAGTVVINCGSAGMPVDGDPHPAYALLHIKQTGRPSAKIVRFSYPQEELIRAIAGSSLPPDIADNFTNGIKKREKT